MRLHIIVPLLAAGVLVLLDHRLAAAVVVTIAAVLLLVAWAYPLAGARVQAAFLRLGDFLFLALSRTLLIPVFLVGFSIAHVIQRISGDDPLHLRRRPPQVSGWLPAVLPARKARHVRSMFAVEPIVRRGRPMLVAAVSLLLAVGLAEAGLRTYGFGKPVLYSSDVFMGYHPTPNQAVTRYGGTSLRINNYGMRGPDLAPTPEPGVLRILLIGNSTLYGGSYISDEQRYAWHLERLLNEAGLPRRVQIASMAANGWGPFHKLGFVARHGVLGADIAVVCMPLVDIHRSRYGLEALPFMSAAHPPRAALEEIFYHLTWRYRARMQDPPSGEQSELGVAAYAELSRQLRAAGAQEVYFAVLPARDGDDQQWIERLRDAVAPTAEAFDYPSGVFAAQDLRRVYRDALHLDVQGHDLYAQHLAGLLLKSSAVLQASTDTFAGRQP